MGISLDELSGVIKGIGKDDVLAVANHLRLTGEFVEVGTFKGVFAERLCAFTNLAKLYCVDPYRAYDGYLDAINGMDMEHNRSTAQARLSAHAHKVVFIRDFSVNASRGFADASLDLVYLDGNHQYDFVLGDLRAWYPKVRPGGLLCGDDAVDGDDARRDEHGNVEIVWGRDPHGRPISWGRYGIVAALKRFLAEMSLSACVAEGQFFILKE